MHRPRTDVLPGTGAYAPGWERTVVTRPLAVAVSILFGAGLLVIPVVDAWRGSWLAPAQSARAAVAAVVKASSAEGPWWRRALAANRAAVDGIRNFETSLEDSSAVAAAVRPVTLDALLRFGGAGSEEAYVGHDGWLFYRPDVDALMDPGGVAPEAPAAIARLAADLAERGIRLVFVPVPGKASIHPEMLSVRHEFRGPLLPAGWGDLPEAVRKAWEVEAPARGLRGELAPQIFDPGAALWERRSAQGDQFLATDSHWRPEAMEEVAAKLADVIHPDSALTPATPAEIPHSGLGDTARMLSLPENSMFRGRQAVAIRPVLDADGTPIVPDPAAAVLVLGDSYTNIFSDKDLGWGGSAGLAEHLSRFLGGPVDRLARNDAGAREARRMLVAAAARDPAWLRGKKTIVWQVAARELVHGDWSDVAWEPATGAEPGFFVAPAGQPVEVTADIAAMGPVPRPGTTPYADYLTALRLTDLKDAAGTGALDGDALVYVFTMRGHQLLPAAGLSPGKRVRMVLRNYEAMAGELDSVNRGELDDVEVMLETPNFAEWLPFSEH